MCINISLRRARIQNLLVQNQATPACLWVHFTSDIWTENERKGTTPACLRPQQSGVSWSRRPSQAISCLPDTDQGAGNGDNQWRGDTVLLRTLATGGLEEGGDTNTQSGGSTSHQRLRRWRRRQHRVCHGHHEGTAGVFEKRSSNCL